MVVTIVDDVPEASGLTLADIADTATHLTGQIEDLKFGADSDGSTVEVTVTLNDGTPVTYTGTVSGEGDAITIDFGDDNDVISLDKDGNLSIKRGDEVGDKQDDTYQVSVKVTDKDGDIVRVLITDRLPEGKKGDIDLTRKVLLATAAVNDQVLKDPAPEVYVAGHAESGLTVRLRVWCTSADFWTVYFDMWEDVKVAFDKFGIRIPYQVINVNMDNSND